MTKKELLLKYKDQACNNLLAYSETFLMNSAREGFEKEFNDTQEEIELLDEIIEDTVIVNELINEKRKNLDYKALTSV